MNLVYRGAVGPASGWLARAQRLLETCPGRRRSTATACCRPSSDTRRQATSSGCGASQREAAAVGERFGDRDLISMATARAGTHARPGRPRPRGPRAPRRGDGDRDDERPLAVRRRHRLLRRDPRLPGGLRGRTGARMDAGADRWVRAAARPRRVHRPLPRPSRRDPAARRIVVRRARGGPASRPSGSSRRRTPRRASPTTGRAELLRLRGEFAAAEEAYRDASRYGWEPQPGLAQLRLAQGKRDAALAAIRRACGGDHRAAQASSAAPGARRDRTRRGRDRGGARGMRRAGGARGRSTRARCSDAIVAYARGAVALAEGDAQAALARLREAQQHLARARRAVRGRADTRAHGAGVLRARRRGGSRARARGGRASSSSGSGPRPTWRASSRRPTATRTASPDASSRSCASSPPGRATARSPSTLVISEHTVARHVQNIYAKLARLLARRGDRLRVRARARLTRPRGQK